MTIEPINGNFYGITEELPVQPTAWSQVFVDKVHATNNQLITAANALSDLATGKAESLHQTMIHLEAAKLSLAFLVQIRNRMISAYQELFREQI